VVFITHRELSIYILCFSIVVVVNSSIATGRRNNVTTSLMMYVAVAVACSSQHAAAVSDPSQTLAVTAAEFAFLLLREGR
jgi:hypothetical protein